jgi:hypothetical protein
MDASQDPHELVRTIAQRLDECARFNEFRSAVAIARREASAAKLVAACREVRVFTNMSEEKFRQWLVGSSKTVANACSILSGVIKAPALLEAGVAALMGVDAGAVTLCDERVVMAAFSAPHPGLRGHRRDALSVAPVAAFAVAQQLLVAATAAAEAVFSGCRRVDISPFTSVADIVGSTSFVNFFRRSGVLLAFAFDGLAETAGAALCDQLWGSVRLPEPELLACAERVCERVGFLLIAEPAQSLTACELDRVRLAMVQHRMLSEEEETVEHLTEGKASEHHVVIIHTHASDENRALLPPSATSARDLALMNATERGEHLVSECCAAVDRAAMASALGAADGSVAQLRLEHAAFSRGNVLGTGRGRRVRAAPRRTAPAQSVGDARSCCHASRRWGWSQGLRCRWGRCWWSWRGEG